jgi:hypothetical protein
MGRDQVWLDVEVHVVGRPAGVGHQGEDIGRVQTAPESQRPIQRLRTRQLSGGQLGGQLDQRQHRQSRHADQEPVRRRAVHQSECRSEGLPLRSRKPLETAQERDRQLMRAGETHVHFSLCTGYPGYRHVTGLSGRPVQQRRLGNEEHGRR